MKRLITILVFIGLALVSQGQQLNPKGLYIGKTIPVVTGSMIQRIDSLGVDNMTTPTNYRLFHDGDTLIPYVPVAGRTEGIALADSTGVLEGSYATGLDNSLKVNIADTTNNAAGNYMTRQNYYNDPGQDNVLKLANGFAGSQVYKGESILSFADINAGAGLTDEALYFTLVYIPEACTVTGLMTMIHTAGNYTPNNYNGVALYSISGSTYTLVASSTNDEADPNIWEAAANTVIRKDFSATYSAAAGYYMGCIIYSNSAETINPKVWGHTNTHSSMLNSLLPDNKKILGRITSRTTLPPSTTAAGISVLLNGPYVMLY